MAESVYKIIELVGTSEKSWEDAVNNIILKAADNLRDIRIAEVLTLDVKIDNNKIALYKDLISLSSKEVKAIESIFIKGELHLLLMDADQGLDILKLK